MSGRRPGFAGNGQPDGDRRRRRRGRGLVVPEAEFRSYYGRPVIKEPAWTIEVPWYFFAGGMAGASAPLAVAARMAGNERLARSAVTVAAAGVAVGTPLLVSDLGRPERFHHMLRVFKPTSPMSMGSWALAAMGPAAVCAAVSDVLRELGFQDFVIRLNHRGLLRGMLESFGVPESLHDQALIAVEDKASARPRPIAPATDWPMR